MPSLRIAHVIPDGAVGGAQEYLASLAAEQAGMGLTPWILTADHGPFVRRYRDVARVTVIPDLHARVAPVRNVRALASLARTLSGAQVDLIHGHTSRGLINAALLRRLLHRPAVVSIHGWDSAHALMSRAGACLATWAKRIATARVDAITVAACAIQEAVVRLGIPRDKVHVVYAGIDTSRFHPGPGQGSGRLRVGAAGRLIPIKGFRFYIEAACTLLDRGAAAEFSLYGDGPEGPALRAMVEARGHAGRIRFSPFQQNFAEIVRTWDVAVVPSVVDSFPFVPLEAMASGVPVIVSAVGGIPEAVRDGVEGLLVPPSRSDLLAAAMERLLGDASLRARMAAAGVSACRERFTWNRAAQDYLALYRRVLGRSEPYPAGAIR